MKQTSEQKIKKAVEILKGFEKGARFYWLEVLVNSGALCGAEAGYIIVNELI